MVGSAMAGSGAAVGVAQTVVDVWTNEGAPGLQAYLPAEDRHLVALPAIATALTT